MDQNFGKFNADLANQAAAIMAQCEISGEWVPPDELVTFQGKRVSAAGKQILLDRLAAGELPAGAAAGIVVIARAQRKLIKLVLLSILGIVLIFPLAALIPSPVTIGFIAILGYLILLVSYLTALYRLAAACGSRWGVAVCAFAVHVHHWLDCPDCFTFKIKPYVAGRGLNGWPDGRQKIGDRSAGKCSAEVVAAQLSPAFVSTVQLPNAAPDALEVKSFQELSHHRMVRPRTGNLKYLDATLGAAGCAL